MASYTETQIHCAMCQRHVLARRRVPNHLIHGLAALFLCGLWVPVWIFVTLSSEKEPWRCSLCGGAPSPFSPGAHGGAQRFPATGTRQPSDPLRVAWRSLKTTKPWQWAVALGFTGLVVAGLALKSHRDTERRAWKASSQSTPAAAKQGNVWAEADRRAEDEACRRDLQCWGDRNTIGATMACQPAVERLAKHSHKWTDGWLGTKFPKFRWKDQDAGIVTYVGDRIQFQNAFGAWTHHIYACDYDTINKRVVDVDAAPGRL